jgi:hypothetical protein
MKVTRTAQGVNGYRLVVPADWYGIELEPARREQSVNTLVAKQFARADNVTRLKAQAKRELLARAAATYEAGGVELFLSLRRVSGVPIPASLAVFLLPPDDGRVVTGTRIAQVLAGHERQVTLVDLPAGQSVRVLRSRAPANELDSAIREVFVPVPDSAWWLLLAFATPVGPLVGPLTGLFDAICATLRWE